MRRLNMLLLLLILLGMMSCRHHHYTSILQTIDSLCSVRPDSARFLLQLYEDSVTTKTEAVRMAHLLLTIKAKDKAYIIHQSDSDIQTVLRYYKKHRKEKYTAEAYYYGGRVYSDLGDAPQALDYFQKAAEMMEGSSDYDLLSRIYSQMGNLFLYQNVFEESMKAYRKCYKYDVLLKDTDGLARVMINIGDVQTAFHDGDSAEYYYKQSLYFAQKINDRYLSNSSHMMLADLYRQQEKYALAEQELNAVVSPLHRQLQSFFANKSDLFMQANQLDSAIYYINQLIEIGDMYGKQGAYLRLSTIATKRHDIPTALAYIDKYNQISKEIRDKTNTESIRRMQSLYNYQLREKKNQQLEKENDLQRQWIYYGAFLMIILVSLMIASIQYNRRRRLRLEFQLRELERMRKAQYEQSEAYIADNERKIQDLEEALQYNSMENQDLRALALAQKEQLILLNEHLKAKQREQDMAVTVWWKRLFTKSSIKKPKKGRTVK